MKKMNCTVVVNVEKTIITLKINNLFNFFSLAVG